MLLELAELSPVWEFAVETEFKKIVGLNDVRDTEQQRADFMQNLGNLQGSCIIHFSRFIFLCNLYVGSTKLPLHSCLTARMRVGIYLF